MSQGTLPLNFRKVSKTYDIELLQTYLHIDSDKTVEILIFEIVDKSINFDACL